MTDWIPVDANEINQEVSEDYFGVNLKVSFSPYDVPRKYRSFRKDGFFVIEFQYLLDEPTHAEKPSGDSPVEFEIGENSKRIYKIKLDVDRLKKHPISGKVDPLAHDVVDAIQQFKKTVPLKFQARYKMPEKVVFNNRAELFSPVLS